MFFFLVKRGGVQAERAHKHTQTPTPQPGVAGRSRNPSPSTHTHIAHPSQERRGTSGERAHKHTHPNTPAGSGGAQPKPEPKHTRPHSTPQPGVAGYKRSAHTNTHTPTPQPGVAGRSRNPSPSTHTHTAHPSQEWRGTSGVRTQAHTNPNTQATSGREQPKTEPQHAHAHRTPQPGVAGYKRSRYTSTHRPQQPSQEWRGAAETRGQAHTPTPHTQARSGGVQAERARKHTQTPSPQPGVAGRSRNPSPSTTQTQTQAPHNSRKPSVHSPGTEAARAMQVTRPNETRSPGVRLHPKGSAALGLEAECGTPKRLETPVPRTC